MTEAVQGVSKTALLHPADSQALVDTFSVVSLSYPETMAEKVRAALCRSEVAIRDYFDVDHAVRNTGFNALEPEFLELLRRKIAIPRTAPMDVSAGRMEQLRRQLEAQLRPVLREAEFGRFELERAIATLRAVAQELA